MIDRAVLRLKTHCEQQQRFASDNDRRNAYNFVERHITTMRPGAIEMHAALVAWAGERRFTADTIRARGVGLALADTLEMSAAVYEELALWLRSANKRKKRMTP